MSIFKNGFLVISLDFELLWGVFDVVDFEKKRDYFFNTRIAIPKILSQFREHEIHATWAVVGMLFNRDWKQWEENIPAILPDYANRKLSAYHFGKSIRSKNIEQMCFARDIISEISLVENQEIGTHTYSHYYCLEEGQKKDQFRADLIQAIKMAEEMGINLKSLVFPRNQVQLEYLKICKELGITNVRSNPKSWYWKDTTSESLLPKLSRTADAYFPLGKKSYGIEAFGNDSTLPLTHRASRFLRPYEESGILRHLKLARIKKEMTIAAQNNKVYHLWWHPHNFGANPEESLQDLSKILTHYRHCRQQFDFQSATMAELGEIFLNSSDFLSQN